MNILSKIFQKKETPLERREKRKALLLTAYEHLTRAKVQGLLSVETDVYDFDTEVEFTKKIYKKGVNMIMYGTDQKGIESYLEYEKLLLMSKNVSSFFDLEDLYILQKILPSFFTQNIPDFFHEVKTSLYHISSESGKHLVGEIINQLEDQIIERKKKEGPYPILNHPNIAVLQKFALQIYDSIGRQKKEDILEFFRNISSEVVMNFLGMLDTKKQEYMLSYFSQRSAIILRREMDKKFYQVASIGDDSTSEESQFVTYEEIVKSLETMYQYFLNLTKK